MCTLSVRSRTGDGCLSMTGLQGSSQNTADLCQDRSSPGAVISAANVAVTTSDTEKLGVRVVELDTNLPCDPPSVFSKQQGDGDVLMVEVCVCVFIYLIIINYYYIDDID